LLPVGLSELGVIIHISKKIAQEIILSAARCSNQQGKQCTTLVSSSKDV